MRRLLFIIIGAVVLAGTGAWVWHTRTATPVHPVAAPFVAQKATLITEGPVTSNLAGGTHYIQLTISFGVMPAALTKVGAVPPGAGTAGTGNPALDAHILAAITALCRQTRYSTLGTPAGLRHFAEALHHVIAVYFPARSVGPVLLTSLVTQ